jgi:hypothetical protein
LSSKKCFKTKKRNTVVSNKVDKTKMKRIELKREIT